MTLVTIAAASLESEVRFMGKPARFWAWWLLAINLALWSIVVYLAWRIF